MTKKAKPTLSVVPSTGLQPNSPPRKLGKYGAALWASVLHDFDMSDAAGREMLCAACQALDRAEACREIIEDEGEMIRTKTGPKENPLCKIELGNRAFTVVAAKQSWIAITIKSPASGRGRLGFATYGRKYATRLRLPEWSRQR